MDVIPWLQTLFEQIFGSGFIITVEQEYWDFQVTVEDKESGVKFSDNFEMLDLYMGKNNGKLGVVIAGLMNRHFEEYIREKDDLR